jgi:N-carbamoylputrescine amidase
MKQFLCCYEANEYVARIHDDSHQDYCQNDTPAAPHGEKAKMHSPDISAIDFERSKAALEEFTKRKMRSTVDITSAIRVAAVQLLPSKSPSQFVERAKAAIAEAVKVHKAQLVLLPDFFYGPYFHHIQDDSFFTLADAHIDCMNERLIREMRDLAKRYEVVLPITLLEKSECLTHSDNGSKIETVIKYGLSAVMIDTDGNTTRESLSYRQFHVFPTTVGKIGVCIGTAQSLPEVARCMASRGANLFVYPSAVGTLKWGDCGTAKSRKLQSTEPKLEKMSWLNPNQYHSKCHWLHTIQGQAAATMMPIIVSNRCSVEKIVDIDQNEIQSIEFYGHSFITNNEGSIIAEAGNSTMEAADSTETIIYADIHKTQNQELRLSWLLHGVSVTPEACNLLSPGSKEISKESSDLIYYLKQPFKEDNTRKTTRKDIKNRKILYANLTNKTDGYPLNVLVFGSETAAVSIEAAKLFPNSCIVHFTISQRKEEFLMAQQNINVAAHYSRVYGGGYEVGSSIIYPKDCSLGGIDKSQVQASCPGVNSMNFDLILISGK